MVKTSWLFTIILFFCFITANSVAQNSGSDNLLRAAIASNSDEFNPDFETTYAKAYADIFLKAHRELLSYPEISISEKIPANDRLKLEALITKLKSLRESPPSWEMIMKAYEDKIILETGPPSAPVFFGDVQKQGTNQTYGNGTKASSIKGQGTSSDPSFQLPRQIIK